MGFNTKPSPTFPGTITITGQGVQQVLNVTFRHKTKTRYGEIFAGLADGTIQPEDAVMEVVEKWDADRELTPQGIRAIMEDLPGFDWAVLTGYGEALTVGRKGNL